MATALPPTPPPTDDAVDAAPAAGTGTPAPDACAVGGIVYAPDSPMAGLLGSLGRVSRSRANVLVHGESGSGKEAIVRLLHSKAPWGDGPFVAINVGAIPDALLESALFGHERGAFTGADRKHVGRFEAASGGTLFLDEIGDMPMALQVKLLRVLQERTFTPLGATSPKAADFRLVAATHVDLEEAVREGRFREDLFYRLDVVRLRVPPLRERHMDVPVLAQHFVKLYRDQNASLVEGFDAEALARMACDPWPGNVRQLENLVQSLLVMREDGWLTRGEVERRLGPAPESARMPAQDGLPVAVPLPDDGLDLRETVEALERSLMRQALRRSRGNRARAASMLGLKRTTLVEKLRRNPVDTEAEGPSGAG